MLDSDHRGAAWVNTLTCSQLAPGAPAAILFSPVSNPVPLAPLGFGPAVLVPDPNAPGGGVIAGLAADANGELALPFVLHPLLTGITLWMQAVSVDPLAPWNGVSLSHGTPFVFGPSRDTHAVHRIGANGLELARVFVDGAFAAPQVASLSNLTPLPLSLTQSPEMAAARNDRPTVDDLGQAVPVIRLADGSVLRAYRAPGAIDLLVRIGPDGSIQELVRAAGLPTEPAFALEIAVSAHEPFAAVVGENPLPEYGGAALLLIRIDGLSHTGSHASVRAVPTPAGLDADSSTLAFLRGALYFGDGAAVLARHDIPAATTSTLVFPPSGGATPVYVDETCAIAEDGSALAIGAGVDDENHDVYVIDDAGVVTNVSSQPGDYEDAAPGVADGDQLAIAPDGSSVAYMRTVLENEAFVRGVAPGSPELHLTPLSWFIDSIDTVTGFGFATSAEIFFSAGQDFNASDVYRRGAAGGVANVTATSGDVIAPYGLGATLLPQRRFTHGSTRFLLSGSPAANLLVAHDAAGATVQLPIGNLETVIGLRNAVMIASSLGGSTTVRTLRTVSTPTVFRTWTSGSAATVVASARDGSRGTGAVLLSNGDVVRATAVGRLETSSPGWSFTDASLAFDSAGRLVASLETGAAFELYREREPGGNWQLMGVTPLRIAFAR